MRVLLVEDDASLSAVLAEQLQKEGYLADCCADGESALSYALHPEYTYDIILLDRMLPVIDGLTVLKAMRQKQIWTPVIVITGLGELDDKVEGLDCGADDYLVKPFSIKELLARMRAVIRRPPDIVERGVLAAFDLTLDTQLRKLRCQNRFVLLTQKETEVLAALMENTDRTYSREQLLWRVWGGVLEVEAGNVDNYIYFLRRRLRELNCTTQIKAVYGAGYRLEEPS